MSERWYIKFALDAYTIGLVEFPSPVDEDDVREWARQWEGVPQLPESFQCWPA